MTPITLFRWMTLAGYFGLMLFLFAWLLWLEPLPPHEISIKVAIGIGPLMFPLRGILHGRAYTHAWSMYLALGYFVVGIGYAAVEQDRVFGLGVTLLSLIFFIGAMFYARYRGRADRQQQSSGD